MDARTCGLIVFTPPITGGRNSTVVDRSRAGCRAGVPGICGMSERYKEVLTPTEYTPTKCEHSSEW